MRSTAARTPTAQPSPPRRVADPLSRGQSVERGGVGGGGSAALGGDGSAVWHAAMADDTPTDPRVETSSDSLWKLGLAVAPTGDGVVPSVAAGPGGEWSQERMLVAVPELVPVVRGA